MSNLIPNGFIDVEGGLATLTFKRRLAYPIEEVWAAITDPEQRRDWFGATAIDGRPGGTIEMVAEGPPVSRQQRTITGRILVWDPPHVFEHEWNQPLVEKGVVRYELAAEAEATILTFTHRGLSVPNAQGYISGTHAFLDRLAAHLDGIDLPNWQQRYAEVQQEYYAPTGRSQMTDDK
ncbi:MAG: SRPBCC family protein [Verrucomicrobia bacterium]|nr:SRPBCC family protein [Verrucomicrobiota bacterium]MBV8485851.1 SRPBCC family protein [Verrucomicrobiota bacterium]